VAEVLKSLTMLNEIKPLSYRERKMLDRARFLLISELAEASGKEADKVEVQIDSALEEALKIVRAKTEH
jgi:CarD family transcriptional regulator